MGSSLISITLSSITKTSPKNNMYKAVVICALAAVAIASQAPYAPPPSYSDAAPSYQYDYAVKDSYSGVDFGQNEARDGYNTQGSYYVALPDGRVQKVTYTVNGDEGYVAEVTYEGEAQYPDHKPSAYKPAPYA